MDEKRLYIHLQDFPYANLEIKGLDADRFEYAQLLCDASEIMTKERTYHDAAGRTQGKKFELIIPGAAFHMMAPVIEVFLK